MSTVVNVLKNHNFWYALIFIGIAAALIWLGIAYMPSNPVLGFAVVFAGVIFSGLSTTFFVITGVQAARKARKISESYL